MSISDERKFKVIDDLAFGNHSILLYDKEDDCLSAQFRWLHNGMKQHQYAIFFTHDNPQRIENKMREFGIDVDTHKGIILDVIQFPSMTDDPITIFNENVNLLRKILVDKNTCRITGRTINDLDSKKNKNLESIIEKNTHSEFDRIKLSILCTYPMLTIRDKKEIEWAKEIIQNHDNIVYVTSEKSITLDPNFLADIV